MNPRLFKKIADSVNRDMLTHNGVTSKLVARVASGDERAVSHPVIARVMSELRANGVKLTR